MSATPDRAVTLEEYREALEALPKGLLLLDEEDIVRFSNTSSTRILGRGLPQMLGHRVDEFVEPLYRPAVRQAVHDLTVVEEVDRHLRIKMLDGHMIPVPVAITLFRLSPRPSSGLGLLLEDAVAGAAATSGIELPLTKAYSLPELLMSDRLKELV